MATVYLKYITWNDGTQQWDTSAKHSFKCLDFDDVKIAEKITGKTIRQIMFSHQKATRKKYVVIIGSDVLYTVAEMTWIKTFWDAQRWRLSTDDFVAHDIEITIPEEELQKGRTAGHKDLPKVSIEMFQKEPD